MVFFSYPPTRKQLAVTFGLFATGASLIAFGIHHSYDNIAAQQAQVKARSDYIRARLRKFIDD